MNGRPDITQKWLEDADDHELEKELARCGVTIAAVEQKKAADQKVKAAMAKHERKKIEKDEAKKILDDAAKPYTGEIDIERTIADGIARELFGRKYGRHLTDIDRQRSLPGT